VLTNLALHNFSKGKKKKRKEKKKKEKYIIYFFDFCDDVSEWTVHESNSQPRVQGTLEFSEHAVKYSVSKRDESSSTLVGQYTTHDNVAVPVKIEFDDDSVSRGRFLLGRGSDAESAEWHSLFAFAFVRAPNSNAVSQGVWTSGVAAKPGWYQFIVTSDRTFLLTHVVDGRVRTVEGLKFVAPVEQSFLQRYGMMILMFSFMLITQVMKNRMSPAAPAATPAPTAATVQAAPRTKKE
jgi:hypothetical protein